MRCGVRVLVTGATGFVGGRVATALAAEGHTVTGTGRRPDPALPGVTYRRWDLTDGPWADPPTVDAVVHAAAAVDDWLDPATAAAVNVDGTAAVLETFVPRARLVHLSSASVYDPFRAHHLVGEEAAPVARYRNAYGATKAAAERLIAQRAPESVVLRPMLVYGPGDTTLAPRLLAARHCGVLPAIGNGTNRLSTTHVDGLVDAVRCALEGPPGTYNVADAEAPTVAQLLDAVLGAASLPLRVRWIPAPVALAAAGALELYWRPAGLRGAPPLTRYVAARMATEHTLDTSAARQRLGWAPGHGLHEGLTAWAADRHERRSGITAHSTR